MNSITLSLNLKFEENLTHSNEELAKYNNISEQKEMRAQEIEKAMSKNNIKVLQLMMTLST